MSESVAMDDVCRMVTPSLLLRAAAVASTIAFTLVVAFTKHAESVLNLWRRRAAPVVRNLLQYPGEERGIMK